MPKIDKKARSRAFCMTSFAEDPPVYDKKKARYYIIGSEHTKKGQHHWQCYVYYHNAISWSKYQKMFPGHHFEICRGTPDQNHVYCTKENLHEEWGERPEQGARSDIKALYELAKENASIDKAWDECGPAMIRYSRGYKECREHYRRRNKSFTKLEVICLYGPPEIGKSSLAREIYGEDLPMPHIASPTTVWFDAYDNDQDTIIFDDFYGGIDYAYLLKLIDGYPFNLPIKGGFVWKRYKRVIFTSNKHPSAWEYWSPALARRFTRICEVRDSITRTSVQKLLAPPTKTPQEEKENTSVQNCAPEQIEM